VKLDMGAMREGLRCRARQLVGLTSVAVALCSRPAWGTDLPGAELTLQRSHAARDCMDETALSAELRARMAPTARQREIPARLEVKIDAGANGYSVQIRASGRIKGERTLSAAGPGCKALENLLVVSLLLMLDDTPSAKRARPAAEPPSAAPSEQPAEVPAAAAGAADSEGLWVASEGLVTLGIPLGASFGVGGDLSVRQRVWEAGLTGFWIQNRERLVSPGRVELRVIGSALRGCGVHVLNARFRVNACAAGMLNRLRGEGFDFTTNEVEVHPWFLAGAGAQLRWAIAPRVALGLSAFGLVSLWRPSFFVDGIGTTHEAPVFTGWFAAEAGVRIW
jgi:hypothetical protein